MQNKTALWAALCACAAHAATAQGISDDVVRIGFITDMTSVYADADGPVGLEAIRMAIEDAGGEVLGKKIELLFADHQMRADVASARAREWLDRENVDFLIGGTNSSAMLAIAAVAAEKRKPFLTTGGGAVALHNQQCTPYTIQYAYATTAMARGTGTAMVREGGNSWFFLTADYAFGHSLEEDASTVVRQAGGEVRGAVRVPLGASDFSSFLLQAQGSGAQVLALANASNDTISSVRAAHEFGVSQSMRIAGLVVLINDVHALGLESAQGMYLTDSWYWDQSDAAREFSARMQAKTGLKPNFVQAAAYSATRFYLQAVRETGTDDADAVLAWMKSNPVNDMFATNGRIRKDGLMEHDFYLRQVKTPQESSYPWDYYRTVATLPREDLFITPQESVCPLWQ